MKITLLITSFNSVSQMVFTYLKDKSYLVDIVYINSALRDIEIEEFNPDIILCPFLKHYIPRSIYTNYPTFVFHPGIVGDRGAYSLEKALKYKEWGVVILKANELFDGGDIYANINFKVKSKSKSSLYRNEVKYACYTILDKFFSNLKDNKCFKQILNPLNQKVDISIDWQNDTAKEIIRKINSLDGEPGVKDNILGIECYLFGAWEEEKLKGEKEKEILAKRDGAICISTIDSSIWISHLKEINRFKLPATYVLKNRLKGVKEHRIPLIFDKSYKTFYEISCDIVDNIAFLYFNFYNGAMSANKCIKLKYAFEYIASHVDVVILMGGEQFFSNGIDLNILEDSNKQGEDGWENINAMNELVESILFQTDAITIASFYKNAGAGGVFLGLACDFVVACEDSILNPHYKSLGLSGSEYHTYSMPKRVGEIKAQDILNNCLPISAYRAKNIGLIDEVFEKSDYKNSLLNYANSKRSQELLWDKEEFLEENKESIISYKEEELRVMYPEFWDENSLFHKLRYNFVYKVCPTTTPKRLKQKPSYKE